MEKRLTLNDFKLSQVESQQELEKMMGMESVAASCHTTCNPDKDNPDLIDWVDHE